jgi:hypothetical protein
VDELSFRCGQMSVRREAANMLPIIAGIRQCSAVDEGEGNSVGSKVETEDALRTTVEAKGQNVSVRADRLKPLFNFRNNAQELAASISDVALIGPNGSLDSIAKLAEVAEAF